MATDVEIRLLGPVQAVRGDDVLAIGGARQRALLALLAIRRGQWLPADRLVDDLFGEEPPEGAATTLRSYVSRVRSALGDGVPITSNASGYSLELPRDAIDSERFEALVRDGEEAVHRRAHRVAARSLRAALALWRGTPFGGLAADGTLRIEAERLEELRLHALELRIEADLGLGAAGELVDELEALVREHPYREAFWRQLMLALYRSQRQADALAAYHRARVELDEQLGIEPGRELVELEAAILRHEVPVVAVPERRHNLPEPVTSFIGRQAELTQVATLLESSRIVTLTGVGGVGKTRLALEAARGAVPAFADGVAFVDLAPLADPELVPDQVVTVLEAKGLPAAAPIDRLVGHLREREMLLVLDNCEHMLASCAAVVTRLLGTCPGVRVLATSRELLGIAGESNVAVPPLALPVAGDPAAVRDSDAVGLFVARARAAQPGLQEDDATLSAIGRICTDLEGIPLAIELAAARARVLSPAEIGQRLGDRFRFLVSWRRLTTARHRTLREAIDWSYDLLDAASQRLLAELSIFAGGFSLAAVERICTIDPSTTALDEVQRLVEASLVTVDQEGSETRYGMLETVREYGSQRLEASGGTDALRRRHAAHFAAVADEGWLPMRLPVTAPYWLAWLRADRDNLRVALAWSLDHGETRIGLQITGTLWRYWWVRGEAAEGRTWLERTLAGDDGSEPALRARSLIGLAGLLWSLGDFAAAESPAEEALALGVQVGDDVVTANASNTLGLIASGRGELARARAMFAQSAARYRVADLPFDFRCWNLAIAIDNLGSTAYEEGDEADAHRHWTEARSINESVGSEEGVAMNDLHLSIVEAEAGRLEEARPRLARSLSVYQRLDFLHYAAEGLEVASAVANRLGIPHEAAFALGAATRIHQELDNRSVPIMAGLRERETAAARAVLGDASFETAFAEGRASPAPIALRRVIDLLDG